MQIKSVKMIFFIDNKVIKCKIDYILGIMSSTLRLLYIYIYTYYMYIYIYTLL